MLVVDVNKAIILLWLFLFTGGKTNMTHIQLLKKNGKYIVFNPESLSLFSVTEKIGMILESYQFGSEYPPKDFNSIEIDIAELLDLFDKKINCDIPNNKSWVVSRKCCNFVAALYPTIITLCPSLNTFYL